MNRDKSEVKVRDVDGDYLEALKDEYRKYSIAGHAAGIKSVAAELHKLGYDVQERAVPADTAEKVVPKGRRPRKTVE